MLDKITMKIPDKNFPIEKLESYAVRGNGTLVGSFRGFRINQDIDGFRISGSIPKYINGDNVKAVNRHKEREAFRRLEEETGVSLKKAEVYQLEVGDTLPVRNPPALYMQSWGGYGKYKLDSISDGETVCLRTKSRVFIGYDKGLEIAPKFLPESFGEKYGLRLEWKALKGVKRVFGHFPSPYELTERDVHYGLIERWQNEYFKIPKETRTLVDMNNLSPSELERALAIQGLKSLGLTCVQSFIEQGQKSGDIHRRNTSRMKTLVKDMLKADKLTVTAPLTEEVDNLVRSYR